MDFDQDNEQKENDRKYFHEQLSLALARLLTLVSFPSH